MQQFGGLIHGKLAEEVDEDIENMTEDSDEEIDAISGLKKSKYMMKTEFTALMNFIENFK